MVLKSKRACLLALLFNLICFYGIGQDLRLWYKQPARQWEECVALGNGRLGMTPDGGVDREEIVLNEISLWSGSPQDANNYDAYKYLPEIRQLLLEGRNDEAQAIMEKNFICTGAGSGSGNGAKVPFGSYEVLGRLAMNFTYGREGAAVYSNYRRGLSLDSALAYSSYEINGVHYRKEYFTSFGSDVDVVRVTADKPGSINCVLSIGRPERAAVAVREGILTMSGQLDNGRGGGGMKYVSNVKAVNKGGSLRVDGNSLVVTGASELTIYISAATDYFSPGFEAGAGVLLTKAVAKPYAAQLSEHVAKFQSLFGRVSLTLGTTTREDLPSDQRLEAFQRDPGADNRMAGLYYQFGRYLAICSTRPGCLPPNLQGLWAQQIQTPWNSDYHLDVNLEMNEWPFNVSNLSELDLPFVELVKKLVPNGRKTAKAYYNADGWVAHVVSNVWHFTEPGESATWGSTKCGSGWLCSNLWEHYAFTNDINYLKGIYPVLKEAARFYMSTMVRDPRTGWLVTSPSSSPENAFYLPNGKVAHACMGPTIDNQIVRELYMHLIEATRLLGRDKGFSDTLVSQLAVMPPAGRTGADGRIMEWLEDYKETEATHRHISHLYGLYPAGLITPDSTPELAAAAAKTLNVRGDDGPSWSNGYKMLWWSRLYDGNRAYKLFLNLVRPTLSTEINYGPGGGIYPNFFSAGPPFQIDANFGGTAGIAEMLLQSHAGYIHLLPALPDAWKKEGEVRGLKARGSFIVDMRWKEGKIVSYRIYSAQPRQVRVKVNGQLMVVNAGTEGDGVVAIPFGAGNTISYDLRGGTYSVAFGGKASIRDVHALNSLDTVVNDSRYFRFERVDSGSVQDEFGKGKLYTVSRVDGKGGRMKQFFWVYKGKDYFFTRVVMSGVRAASNYSSPLVTKQIGFSRDGDNRVLSVPFDNDMWVRYDAMPLDGARCTSSEVTAVYNSSSYNGLVIGSLEHGTWKTGIRVEAQHSAAIALSAYGGLADSVITHDKKQHGVVMDDSGHSASPKIMVGYFKDWRKGMEEYGSNNRLAEPPVIFSWNEGTPVGWNSWGAMQNKLSLERALAVVDFFHDSCTGFRNSDHTLFIDLDAYWNEMLPGGMSGDLTKLKTFVAYCNEKGFRPGIYWAPFVDWSRSDRKVEGSDYNYSECWTKVNGKVIDVDGGLAVDPTHPAIKRRTDYFIDKLKALGFKMIKIDFLGHGALEADSYYDPNVHTGMQAYKEGMEYLANRLGNSMLVYAAISPSLATARYVHMRRIACDAFKRIDETAYTLNAATYGWWLSKMYNFSDADHVVFGDAGEGENRARLASAVVTGTLITGDDYSQAGRWKGMARALLQNKELLGIVGLDGKSFRPVEVNTGKGPAGIFTKVAGNTLYVAIFNYSDTVLHMDNLGAVLSASQLSVAGAGRPVLINAEQTFSSRDIILAAKDAAIIAFTLKS